ncbi:nitric oxide reductase activation protein NorD [Serpens gallinarum]|uniref:VWA domain-containing protein n=1 Tax=Serpens gallinarum TaxID=2763075 RepID=A0ABR8TR44_9PSED|nr:VWA domain-containing protein [Serpens gallinarum]MBD7978243.1 VWA domain-containing protein [Serpens gallinarum]
MAEAEDVLSDVARHATIYIQRLWRRQRSSQATPKPVGLEDLSERLDLLIQAALGCRFPLRIAQPPAPPTLLQQLWQRGEHPRRHAAIPATDDRHIWLPAYLNTTDAEDAAQQYRTLALQQAMRARRGSATHAEQLETPLQRALYLLCEAWAADCELLDLLPGLAPALAALRQHALRTRPALEQFPAARQPVERFLRTLLQDRDTLLPPLAHPAASVTEARRLATRLMRVTAAYHGPQPLLLDCWTGELRPAAAHMNVAQPPDVEPDTTVTRSAHLPRSPRVRESQEDEDDRQPGAWMIQPSPPLEQAEDAQGLQRPTDRDDATPAEEFADALSELEEARLIVAPGTPREVLISEDSPRTRALRARPTLESPAPYFAYPEWDYRSQSYRQPGAFVHLLPTPAGPAQWVTQTLEHHRSLLTAIRRQFEMLRAQRQRLRRQLEGNEPDLDAYLEGLADARAGLCMPQALYQTQRTARRDMAIMLLVDASGSTDGWLSRQRRIIDVEREALLLVCLALEGLGQPYSVKSFSGEGPQQVTMRTLKAFDEHYNEVVGKRIAALEPERYTRAGAAIRHASASLMREPASHRLLLLLSDGKPNDVDEYEGRYGVEDMRQAVNEARLQGIHPFCLTIDRQAATYLPAVFGARHYALLASPERLPAVLLNWLRQLITH